MSWSDNLILDLTERSNIILRAFEYYKANGAASAETDGYKEVIPNVFRPVGYYRHGDYTIPADFFPMEKKFKTFMFKDGDVVNADAEMNECCVSLAPLYSCKVWYINRWWNPCEGPDRAFKLEAINGQISCGYCSESPKADFIFKLCEVKGIKHRHTNPNMTCIYNDPSSDVHFIHCVYEYGFNNKIFIEYRFDDLINMDINEFEPYDVKTLKDECEQHPFLKNVVNFKLFRRPLTDIEKTSCATKFFNEFKKQIKKKYRPYATSKY